MILGESQQFASPEEALEHYGVKGMRKGRGKPNRIDRKNGRDPKRLAILYGRRRGKTEPFAVQNKIAEHINQKIGTVNDKHKNADFSDADWGDPSTWSPQTKEYYAEVTGLAAESTRLTVKDVYGSESNNKHRAELNEMADQIVVREAKVKHAADDPEVVAVFKITRDAKGLVAKVEPLEQEEAMSQTTFEVGEEFIEHFGVKGMQWGVRKERARNLKPLITKSITRTTKNGDQFTVSPDPPNKLHKALAFASKSYANNYREASYLVIRDKNGKKVGEGNFWNDKKDPDALYLNWVTVKKSARGKGYASEVLRAAEDHARSAGKKKMKLEVPGNAPDARHIYEKQGFKVTKESTLKDAATDSVWGGLTHMEKRLDNKENSNAN